MPITEFVTFKASEAYIADSAVIQPAVKLLAEHEGVLSVFTGFEVEDPTVGYLFVVWEKLEHHEKLMQDSSYPTILSTLAAAQSGPPLSMLHFDMTDDPTKGLTAPVTDLTYMTLKEGKTKADVEPFFATFAWIADLGRGFHHGQCVEKPELFVVLMGWASIEAHMEAGKAPEFAALVGDALAVMDIHVKHAKIHKSS